jgi:hypothetical protein
VYKSLEKTQSRCIAWIQPILFEWAVKQNIKGVKSPVVQISIALMFFFAKDNHPFNCKKQFWYFKT